MAKSPKFKSLWPCPVYVATFADGTTQRMSFASPANKPLDFDRGRRLLAWACAQKPSYRQWGYGSGKLKLIPARYWAKGWERLPIGMRGSLARRGMVMRDVNSCYELQNSPRADMIAGHVEHDGQRHEDPFFAPHNVVAMPKKRVSKTAAELEKAVAIIAALEAQFGACFPAECAEAMEFLLNREAA